MEVSTNPHLYDGTEGALTKAVFELLDYMKEHFPLTPANVDTFERGSVRYFEKIERLLQEYYESLPDCEKAEYYNGVAKLVDRFTVNTRLMIQEVRRKERLARRGDEALGKRNLFKQ